MIYKDNERVKITDTQLYKELCVAFPEIEKKQPVILELVESAKMDVETSDGQSIKVWPEHLIKFEFESVEGADKVVWRLQQSVPTKDKGTGDYKFQKVSLALSTTNSPQKVFVTDPASSNCNLEELFLIYHFYKNIVNGKAGDGVSGQYRFVNKEKDEQDAFNEKLAYSKAIVALEGADLNVLTSLFESIYETTVSSGVTRSSLVTQFSNRIEKDKVMLEKVSNFFSGLKGGVSQDVIDLVKLAVEKGVLVTGADGSGVFLKTTNKTDEILADKTTEDVEIIAEFVSKNNSLKGNLRKLVK